MKKTLSFLVVLLTTLSSWAISPDVFNHLGAGVGVGTTGITFELATPITSFVQMRAGVSYMPAIKFSVNSDVEYNVPAPDGQLVTRSSEVKLKGNLDRVQGQVIFNVYPIPGANFFVAAGAYFGGNKMVKITGHSDEIASLERHDGYVNIGDYRIPVDDNGDVKGGIKVNSFRPYFGVGYGRALPGHLLGFAVELGVQIHGKPKLYTDYGQLDLSAVEDDDTFQKIMDKVKVYPNLSFRLNFRAF